MPSDFPNKAYHHRSSRQGYWDRAADPVRLDRAADIELQLGHVARAEFLSRQAEDLRAGVSS